MAIVSESTVKKILEVFEECAPSAHSKDMMCQALAEAKEIDNQPPRVLVRMVAEALVDGLRYSNWLGESHYPTGWRS